MMKMIDSRAARNEGGFTMLELMIAVMILAIGLLGIAALQVVAIQGNVDGKEFTLASSVAGDAIENFRNGSFDDIQNRTDYVVFSDGQPTVTDSKPSDGFYMTRTSTVKAGPEASVTKAVTIQVSWTDENSMVRKVTYETVIGNI